MEEIWKPITVDGEIYENYSVSSEGNVKNNKTGRVLKKYKYKNGYKNGYELVTLCKNGKTKTFQVHRLVAIMFIPNPENKTCVDHINCVRNDNRVENLRWVTHKENSNNPLTLEKQKGENHPMYGCTGENHPKSTKVICITTGVKYESITEAERQTGVNQGDISKCCNGKRYKSAGKSETGEKLVWMFYKDYLEQNKNHK